MGGHFSYIFTGNLFQLSYGPVKFSGEQNFINSPKNESLVNFPKMARCGSARARTTPIVTQIMVIVLLHTTEYGLTTIRQAIV